MTTALLLAGAVAAVLAAVPAVAGGRDGATSSRNRARLVRDALPDALDLLAAALDGGASVERGLEAVGGYVPDPLGATLRAAALGAGGARPAVTLRAEPDLRATAALLAASDDLGVPLAEALRDLASDERERQSRTVRLRAAAAGPRMTLVVGGLLAPAALLLVVGAEVLAVFETVGSLP